jgi:hypothetical protein
MKQRYFCTYFDSNYLSHALSLHASLSRHCSTAHLFMVCMDDNSYVYLKGLNIVNVTLIRVDELEGQVRGLAECRHDRTLVEYYYTCSAAICYFILHHIPGVHELTYLDADLYFYNSPEPIFNEMEDKSIGVISHRFSLMTRRNIMYGKYNVGWITFRHDDNGMLCVKDWKDDCIAWCFQKVEENRYADQKYLDYWENRYKGVHVIRNIGANVAIWNVANYRLSIENKIVLIDSTPLIFYHFANFKQYGPREFKTDLSRVFIRLEGVIKDDIYVPYANSILSFAIGDYYIKAKADIHVTGIMTRLRVWSHKIRDFFYPDIIKL